MDESRTRWVLSSVIVILALGSALVLWNRDTQVEPPGIFGRVWTGGDADPALLFYVTREERRRLVRGAGRPGVFRSKRYDRYALDLRHIRDGHLVQSLPLGDLEERQETHAPQILGIVDDVVWIWRDGVEARTLPNLELRCDTARLESQSPDVAAVLPGEPKGFAVMPEPRTFLMRGRDARLYAIDPLEATFTPIEPERLPPNHSTTRAEDRFDYLVAPGCSRITTSPYNLLQKSFLTRTGQWYALLSESERATLTIWPPREDRPYGDVARSLHRADYRMDGNSPAIDPAAVVPVGDVRLLQSGFLVRGPGAMWDVPDPSSTLVIAKSLLGDTEPWEVVRLARDGTVVWRTSTDLADIGELLDLGTHVLFIGRRVGRGSGANTQGDTRERIVWIDERTGARRTLFVATGESEEASGGDLRRVSTGAEGAG